MGASGFGSWGAEGVGGNHLYSSEVPAPHLSERDWSHARGIRSDDLFFVPTSIVRNRRSPLADVRIRGPVGPHP